MMERNMMRSVLKTTIIYFGLIAVVVYFTYLQALVVPIDTDTFYVDLDLSNFFMPLTSLLLLNYASNLVRTVLIGDLVGPLSRLLQGTGFTSFVWLLSISDLAPDFAGELGFIFFACSVLVMIQSNVVPLLRKHNRPIVEIVVKAVVILGVTWLLSQASVVGNDLLVSYGALEGAFGEGEQGALTATIFFEFFGRLDFIVLLSGAITAVLALAGLARSHEDPYISYVSGAVGSKLGRKYLYLFLFFSYLFVFRGLALELVGINPQIMTVAEWAVVCLVSYLSYRGTRKYVAESLTTADRHGEWGIHYQEVERTTDTRLDDLTRILERFTETGDKDMLIVFMVDLLRSYGISKRVTANVLSGLIRFRDRDQGVIFFAWRKSMIEAMNREERKEAVDAVMEKMRGVGMNMSYRTRIETETVEEKPNIEQEVITDES